MDNNNSRKLPGKPTSLWLDTSEDTSYSGLEEKDSVDVAIIGGGIAGLITAYLIKRAGKKVAVIESHRIAQDVTGNTTAKVTSLHGLVYKQLIDAFGLKKARLYAEANQQAIDDIEKLAKDLSIDCDFKRMPAYTYTTDKRKVKQIKEEVKAAQKLGLPAIYDKDLPLPFNVEGAIKLDNQAIFHPRKFLISLSKEIHKDGSKIYEHTKALKIEDGDTCTVTTNKGPVEAKSVIIATNFPIYDPDLYFARLNPMRSFVLGALVEGPVPQGMFFGLEDQTVRPHPYKNDEDILIIGGQTHKTGHGGDTVDRFKKLEQWARDNFKVKSIEYRWAAQDNHTYDNVPMIGKISIGSKNVYVATGFKEWGMTHGMVAANLLTDIVTGKKNPWASLYNPSRPSTYISGKLVKENVKVIKDLAEGRIYAAVPGDIDDLAHDEAKVMIINDDKVAAYKDDISRVHAVSPNCTHMGCVVNWNSAEKSWDCPCHGSRFSSDGKVLHSPAIDDLETKELPGMEQKRVLK